MISLRLLGGTDLSGAPADPSSFLSHTKPMAVLAYLAVEGRSRYVRRDVLAGLFWPESDHARARNALNQVLHEFRNSLGRAVLRNRGKHEVGLDPEQFDCDVWSFLDAVREKDHTVALNLYRGEFLPGFFLNGNREFENWLESQREQLREIAAGAAWAAAHQSIERGDLVRAERTAQEALSLVWSDETPIRGFIHALARAGDRSAALWFFEKFRQRLQDELELEPSPATLALVEEIRSHQREPCPAYPTPAPWPHPTQLTADYEDPRSEGSGSLPIPDSWIKARGRWPRRVAIWGLPGLALVAFAALWLWPGIAWEPDPGLVAVAPFQNRTGDPAFDDLGSLVAAGIQFRLDRGGIAEVAAHPLVEFTLGTRGSGAEPFQVLSEEMGAGVVVTGEISLRGDSLWVRPHCVDARTGRAIHPIAPAAVPVGMESSLVTLLQDRVSAVLAQHFDTAFGLEPDLAPPPLTLEAYQEYRRGFEVYRFGGTRAEAAQHLRRAWELDPEYLEPALLLLSFFSRQPELYPQFDTIFGRLDEARHKMTPYQRHYFDGIQMASRRNQELAYQEFLAMAELGRFRAAAPLAEKALSTNRPGKSAEVAGWLDKGNGEFLEPWVAFWPGYWSFYTYALHLTGQYEKELEIAREWQRRFPAAPRYPVQAQAKALIGMGTLDLLEPILEDWRAQGQLESVWAIADELWVHGHRQAAREVLEAEVRRFETDPAYRDRLNNQAMVLHRLGRDAEAHALWEEGIDLDRPHPWPWGVARIGFSAAIIGDTIQARAMERLLLSVPEPQDPYTPFLQAQIAAALGEKGRAVGLLAAFAREGSIPVWLNNVHRDFTLQRLLGDYPPFQAFMRPRG